MRSRLLVALLALAPFLTHCGGKEAMGQSSITLLGSGVINDPANKSLRFDLLQYGLEQFCFEMQRRGAPLKMSDSQPILGRFFATQCSAQVLDEEGRQSLVLQFSGTGYAWNQLSQRLGFKVRGVVEYAPDFLVDKDSLYVYFRPRNVSSVEFETLLVESQLARAGMVLTGFDANATGRQIVEGQLKRGFTVIRLSSRGEMDFGLGYVAPGARPFRPYQVGETERLTLANDRTEIHQGQQDIVSALEVKESGQKLSIVAAVDGAPAIDLAVVPAGALQQQLERFVRQAGPSTPSIAPIYQAQVVQGQPFQVSLPVSAGLYYLVLDHSAGFGATQPAPAVGDQAARVDYLVQAGEN